MGDRDFTIPNKYEFDTDTLNETYGKLRMEPFERGYALTVGVALRRALLSSIESAAAVSVKFDSVRHEFSSIPGVKEDVLDIILNLRQVRMRLVGEPPEKLRLDVSGERKVTAKDFEANPKIEILNPDAPIAELTERDAHLALDLNVTVGRGFVPAGGQSAEADVIEMDANHSPVYRVNYDVQVVQVGERDFERLVLEIWTDGRVTPEKALDEAATILREHFALLAKGGGEEFRTKHVRETGEIRDLLPKAIEETEFNERAKKSLEAEGIKTIEELVSRTEEDLLKFKNLGKKSVDDIKDTLKAMNPGLELGMDLAEYKKGEQV